MNVNVMLNVPGHKRIVNRKRANLREVNRWDLRRGKAGTAANKTVSYMNLPAAPGTVLQEERQKQLLNFLQTAQTQQQQQVAQQVAAQNAATQTAIQQALQQALAQQNAAQQAAIQQAAQQTAQQVVQQQTQASPQPPPPSARRTPSERPRPQASPTPRSNLAQQFVEQIANQPARQYNPDTNLPIANRPARTGSVLELARSNLRP